MVINNNDNILYDTTVIDDVRYFRTNFERIEGLDLSYEKAAKIWDSINQELPFINDDRIYLISDDHRLIEMIKNELGKIITLNVSVPLKQTDYNNIPSKQVFIPRTFEFDNMQGLVLLVYDKPIIGLEEYEGKLYDGKLDNPELNKFIGICFGGEYSTCYEFESFDLDNNSKGHGVLIKYPELYQKIYIKGEENIIVGVENLGFVEKEDDYYPQLENIFRQKLKINIKYLCS